MKRPNSWLKALVLTALLAGPALAAGDACALGSAGAKIRQVAEGGGADGTRGGSDDERNGLTLHGQTFHCNDGQNVFTVTCDAPEGFVCLTEPFCRLKGLYPGSHPVLAN